MRRPAAFSLASTLRAALVLWLVSAGCGAQAASVAATVPDDVDPASLSADLVVVIKSARVLYLYSHGDIIAQYPIALGGHPVGTKRRRGDQRTPVGAYTLDWRNPDSSFYRSIHVSYPNAQDRARARAHGVDPGDLIMIHGQPSYDDVKRTGDWTHGCIAVSDAAIDDIWTHVADGTRIHIYP